MSNLEPIEDADLDLENKFKLKESAGKSAEAEPVKVEKETPKEESAAEGARAYAKILSQVRRHPAGSLPLHEVKSDAESVYQKTDAESQIQHLVDLALNKGVIHAVKVAKHLEDNYALDMFHDRMLSDELHDALLKKGLIKED